MNHNCEVRLNSPFSREVLYHHNHNIEAVVFPILRLPSRSVSLWSRTISFRSQPLSNPHDSLSQLVRTLSSGPFAPIRVCRFRIDDVGCASIHEETAKGGMLFKLEVQDLFRLTLFDQQYFCECSTLKENRRFLTISRNTCPQSRLTNSCRPALTG